MLYLSRDGSQDTRLMVEQKDFIQIFFLFAFNVIAKIYLTSLER